MSVDAQASQSADLADDAEHETSTDDTVRQNEQFSAETVGERNRRMSAQDSPSGFELLHRERQHQEQIFRARKAEKAELQRRVRFLIGTFIFLLVFLVSVFFIRGPLVAIWPPISKLFDVMGTPVAVVGENLLIEEVNVERLQRDDATILSVVGKIRNFSEEVQPIPTFLISLMDSEADIIDERIFGLDVNVILPEEVISFSQEIDDPDPEADDVRITFSPVMLEDAADY